VAANGLIGINSNQRAKAEDQIARWKQVMGDATRHMSYLLEGFA
jgi:hypothetical protein